MKLCDNYVMKNLANETILVHQDEKNVDFSKIINLNEIAVFIINKIQEGLNTLEICKAITISMKKPQKKIPKTLLKNY